MTSNFKSITWVFKLCRDWKNKAKALELDPGMWAIKKQITWNNHWSAIYVKLASPWWHSWRWLADSETPSLCRSPTGSSGRYRFPELCCQDNILEFGPGIKAQMLTSDPFVFMAKPSGGKDCRLRYEKSPNEESPSDKSPCGKILKLLFTSDLP